MCPRHLCGTQSILRSTGMRAGRPALGASVPPAALLWPASHLSGLEAICSRLTGFAFQMGRFKSSFSALLAPWPWVRDFTPCLVVARMTGNVAAKLSA